MQLIPEKLKNSFLQLLIDHHVPEPELARYQKWLRFYLDFCQKYGLSSRCIETLKLFLQKLQDRSQNDQQLEQARKAVSFYFKLFNNILQYNDANTKISDVVSLDSDLSFSKQWQMMYTDLNREIKVRHYSHNTYKTYAHWLSKFQAYVNNKAPKALNTEDVKMFLTHLAVDCKVAASTQNQAFNALLFVFRHILKNEFGKIDGKLAQADLFPCRTYPERNKYDL